MKNIEDLQGIHLLRTPPLPDNPERRATSEGVGEQTPFVQAAGKKNKHVLIKPCPLWTLRNFGKRD